MQKNKFLPLAMLLLVQGAYAQQPLTSGGQMQQIPPVPMQQTPSTPRIELERRDAPGLAAPDAASIEVKALRITGARAFAESELLAVAGFQPGARMTLAQLRAQAARITAYYRAKGYFVAQAYLPAQDIRDGVVELAVMEGQYGQVKINNQARVPDSLGTGLMAGINPGDPVQSGPLEERLLLLSDVPGVNVKSRLAPGAAPGSSDLLVDLTPGPSITGSVDADNAGNRYTGEYRIGATVNLNNPTGRGDQASVRVLTSGEGLTYARAAYQIQVGGRGRVGVAYSHLDYRLGREFESLRAHGTADIASVYGSYTLIRSRNSNMYAHLGYDERTFQDRVDSTASVTDKKAHVLMASLLGDYRDRVFGDALSTYSVTLTAGRLDIQTPAVAAIDAATARTQGTYSKLGFGLTRSQALLPTLSLYAALSGQLASNNLDISEKMGLGGMYGVRAYPSGEAYGDQGLLMNLELRKRLTSPAVQKLPGALDLIAFVDAGTIQSSKNPWAAGSNSRTLAGAGVGATWTGNDNLVIKTYYARKLGSENAISAPDKTGRFWIQAIKFF